jgi:replication factor C subunit 1
MKLRSLLNGSEGKFSQNSPLPINMSYDRFRRRVTGNPSGKTSYVVLGEGAGPKKLSDIKRLGLKTLDEDGFLNLIGTREGKLDAKAREKLRKEEERMEKEAEEMVKAERRKEKEAKKAGTKL